MRTLDDLLRGSVYKSLETDREFVARVREKYPWYSGTYYAGAMLDDEVWDAFKMQRRIVEREASLPSVPASLR